MKKIKLSFAMLLLVMIKSFSQTGIITYKATPDIKETKNSYKIKQEIDLMDFSLKYNKEKSFFQKEKHIPIDKMQAKLALIIIRSYFDWYQSSKERESFYTKEIKGENYWVNHEFKMKDWKLTGGVKVIEGYTCYKAEREELNNRTGKNVFFTAWYTPEIPVPYGPIGNGGLPGLILQLHKHNAVVYTVSRIILNPKNVKVKEPKAGKKISIKEKIKLSRQARKVTKD